MILNNGTLHCALYFVCRVHFEDIQCFNTFINWDKCVIQLHRLIQPLNNFFYHASHSPHLNICHQHELAALFITFIKHLISQARAFQVSVSKSPQMKLGIFNERILNYESLDRTINFLWVLLFWVSSKIGSGFP